MQMQDDCRGCAGLCVEGQMRWDMRKRRKKRTYLESRSSWAFSGANSYLALGSLSDALEVLNDKILDLGSDGRTKQNIPLVVVIVDLRVSDVGLHASRHIVCKVRVFVDEKVVVVRKRVIS